MKAVSYKIQKTKLESIRVQKDVLDQFYNKFHFHPEYQITAIERGSGVVICGNKMTDFEQGDVFFFGPNLPHIFKDNSTSQQVVSISIFYDHNALGENFFDHSLLTNIKELMQLSERGLKVTSEGVFNIVRNFNQRNNEETVIDLLFLLKTFKAQPFEVLNSDLYEKEVDNTNNERINKILTFILNNFSRRISIEEICSEAHLSKSQFSRMFRIHTGKTFISYLNELRIEKACSLLKTLDDQVGAIAHKVGFDNLANFNRKFKELKGETPLQFRKRMR